MRWIRGCALSLVVVLAGSCSDRPTAPSSPDPRPALSVAPCTDCVQFTGSLSGRGATQVQPGGGSYQTTAGGAHQGWLRGPAGTDFVLELQVQQGTRWKTLAKADRTGSSDESLAFTAGAGTYRWQVSSRSGGGAYELWLAYPGMGPQQPAVVSVSVAPSSVTVLPGQTAQLQATGRDASGNVVAGAVFTWSSTATRVATVSGSGLVTGVAAGSAEVVVTSGSASSRVPVTVQQPPSGSAGWVALNAGQNHSCGVQADGAGYCWGYARAGELGTGVWTPLSQYSPVPVGGGIRWTRIDGSDDFSCGLATSGAAYCWGSGWQGQLGNGRLGDSDPVLGPNPVVGGITFRVVDAGTSGALHACGVATDGRAYCWGDNTYGQLGIGTTSVPYGSASPVAVTGGLTFTDISAGRDYTCGITTASDLYCWGDDEIGQLGDNAGFPGRVVPQPVLVHGGHKWRAVDAGDSHVCGVATTGVAYCWGQDELGELGLGTVNASSNVPAPVATSELFTDIGVGTYSTCGISTSGVAHCWGYNWYGTLGRGTKHESGGSPTPAPVLGAMRFSGNVSGGYLHMCALGTDGKSYCWGYGADGEIGSKPEFCMTPQRYEVFCSSKPWPVSTPTAVVQPAMVPGERPLASVSPLAATLDDPRAPRRRMRRMR